MAIFNSLGSNYDFGFVIKALFTQNKNSYKERLINFLEKKYEGRAFLVYKGREAISLALDILNLPKGSQVAINGFTCYAVYKAIETAGYTPVCLDLDPSDDGFDLNFSSDQLLRSIKKNPKIKVVIVQNTLGYPCNIEGIEKICRQNNLILIEDLAHCVGTNYKNGKEAGTIGDLVILSFSQDKMIDAVSGGALIIRSGKWKMENGKFHTLSSKQLLLDKLYPLFTFKIRKMYPIGLGKLIHFILKKVNLLSRPTNEEFYTKYDLPNWYAYLALNALINLKGNLEHRRQIASIYNSMLDKKITSDHINKNIYLSSNLRYPIFVEKRKVLINYLTKEGIHTSDIWYDSVDESLKNAKIISNRILNLPTHRNVSENDARKIAQKINHFILRASSPAQNESRSFAMSSSRLTLFPRTINSKKEWENFLSKHPEANFLQSWYWGEFYTNLGNKILRTGFFDKNKLVGVMLSIVEEAKRGRHLIVPGGPIIDWNNSDLVKAFVLESKKIANSNNCAFIRVRPQLESSDFSKKLFRQNGFIDAPMHLHAELTSQMDLTKTEETLLSNMRKTTRYEIKKAIKEGIKVTSTIDDSQIKEFYDLQTETSKRQKFVPFSYKYLSEQFKVFATEDKDLLYSAYHENKLLAQAFIIFYGKEAVYHYGASTDEGRNYPGAYLIQWEAIKEAKKRGMTRYNFWGVSPIDKTSHRFYGLSLFKRGFGGTDVEYLHAQDLIINYPKYLINYAIESIRKRVRNV